MLNAIWMVMLFVALICGAFTGNLGAVATASIESAKAAVELAIGLVGVMAFWLGLMRVLQEGGFLQLLARLIRPVTTRLFPDIPANSDAMAMIVLNMSSNMLGLGNAATPFGLKAMMAMDKYNAHKGTASNAMALFLAINTSALALFPTGIIGMRAALGSDNPGSIIQTTWVATVASTLVAIVAAKLLCRLPCFALPATPVEARMVRETDPVDIDIDTQAAEEAWVLQSRPPPSTIRRGIGLVALLSLGIAFAYALIQALRVSTRTPIATLMDISGSWMLLWLLAAIVLFGFVRGVRVYDAVVEGGKEGFKVALRIIPFLVAILVAVGMLRASGAIDAMVEGLAPFTSLIGMPAEALPMALLRPLTGSGAYAVAGEIMKSRGPDSLVGQIVSTMQGSTETTFYVLALYFGVVEIKRARHTVAACLCADLTGALVATWACRLLL